jgi:N-acetylmuramoyl-L-alanine amidase
MSLCVKPRWMQRGLVAFCLSIVAATSLADRVSAAEPSAAATVTQAASDLLQKLTGQTAKPPEKAASKPETSKPEKSAAQGEAGNVPAPEPVAQSATLRGDQKRTRFVAGLSKAVNVNVFTLADPYRVVIELPQIQFQLPQAQSNQAHGLVKAYRYGLFAPGKSRIILDVTGPVLVENVKVSEAKAGEPANLSLELVPTERAMFLAGQSRQLVTSAAGDGLLKVTKAPLPANGRPNKVKKPIIVIDPGHGGHDGGANKNGTIEKEVVLAFGLMLREKLLATGRFDVLMTRDSDKFVDLDERREFARKHNAALFMAIHADYIPSGSNVRGATIYTLRESMAKSMARSVDKSVTGDVLEGVEIDQVRKIEETPGALKNILSDLAQRENKPTLDRTNFFAKNVIEYMGQSTELKAEPHREAAFRVLKSAQVPSVLIELAYVSNRQDAANLKSDEWRNRVSASLVAAVNRYFNMALLPL